MTAIDYIGTEKPITDNALSLTKRPAITASMTL